MQISNLMPLVAQPIEVVSVDLTEGHPMARNDAMAKAQEVHFCTGTDGVRIAWTENGTGLPVVQAPNWIGHLELDWRNPGLAPLLISSCSSKLFILCMHLDSYAHEPRWRL